MYVLKTECHFTFDPARQNIFQRLPGLHRALAADLLLEVWEEGGTLVSPLRS
jgi:hypothetical protein